ncbi:LOW QUALITY PROTEIN: protein stoned-B-like [Daktulosphaira vitifoliae]|uniref:LOW QUALITY PROTEIN: protein stoned-B-like n=1 Tax=Daktulosphaira vitifoliae TaxID=58002 RepID=UPI0021AA5D5F|nr:LOW QUALITY PROTEIN: protein stoned-B-like [Daktulosphaira vitifoliae]
MLKIHKGLKKKKKNKKNKHKEDELFNEEELEKYRREHQEGKESEVERQDQEWQKFKAITADIDSVLKKTQGDLDRIKSTSFFQRKPTQVEVQAAHDKIEAEKKAKLEEEERIKAEASACVHASEEHEATCTTPNAASSEEESDHEDDIFDTSYVDIIASGEVKLAYIPESPTEEKEEFDPFDTSIVDKVIKPNSTKKNQRYISLGCAVEVLSGKEVDINPDVFRLSAVRKRPKPVNLLLESFDESSSLKIEDDVPVKTLLDDDSDLPADDLPLTIVTPVKEIKINSNEIEDQIKTPEQDIANIINEFDTPLVISEEVATGKLQLVDDDIDNEFAALAAESLSKTHLPEDIDPFDTSFVDHVVPTINNVNIQSQEINQQNTNEKLTEKDFYSKVRPLSIEHRDLLGGSTTDLSVIGHHLIEPKNTICGETEIDPFDTSIAESLQPGKGELKLLEKEFLNDSNSYPKKINIEEDEDFNPRAEEPSSRPVELNLKDKRFSVPKVTFAIEQDLLTDDNHGELHVSKPLTPYYPESELEEEKFIQDPFDTSHVNHAPGKAELKLLENELVEKENKCTDILTEEEFITHILHTPVEPQIPVTNEIDPFDTSFAENTLPSQTEIKILESELISKIMANPFLVEDISSSVKESNTFNPFLTDASSEINENPFFTSFGGTNNVQDNTNPFFSFTAQPEPQPPVADLLNINEKPQQTITNDSKTKPPPPRPTPPKRPPPRPMPPPALSHEAKELILSVTGEIDATSTHMLDRLAKTPSPTPIRELLTPSPLPTPDLIGDEDLLPPAPSELSLNELQSTSKPERPKFPPKVEYHPDDTLNYISTAEISENSERISKKRTPSIPEKPPSLNSSKPSSRKSSNEFILPVRRLSHDVTESRKIMPDLSKISDRRKSDFGPFSPILTTRQPTSQSDQTFKIKTSTSIKEINESEENKNDEHSVTLYNLAKENSDPSTKINTDNVLIDSIESSQDVPLPWQDEKSNQSFDSQQPEITYDTYKNDLTHQNIIDGTIDSLSSDLCENEKVVTYNFDSNLKEDSFEKISALSSEYISDDKVAYNAYESKPTPPVPDPSPLPEEQNTVTSFVVQNNEIPENAFIAKPVHESFQTFSNFESDAFDAFDAKFDDSQIGSVGTAAFDAFGGPIENITDESAIGFGADDNFDSFLSTHPIPAAPQSTPARVTRNNSGESIDENDFNVYIRPKVEGDEVDQFGVTVPSIAPPPKPTNIFQDGLSSRFNPFDQAPSESNFKGQDIFTMQPISQRTDSQETPPSPLFDEDVSQPLEEFPRVNYNGDGWEMELRQPNKKKITAHRFWKKIFVKIVYQGENPVLQLYNLKGDKDPFQELPLQPSYSVSDIGAQQYDQFGKIFTVKLLYIFYKEKAGFRPGQVTKAERLTNKLSQFAAYAIQGDYQGVKEFGSDIKKLGLPVEHGAQTTTLLKLGSHSYEDMKQFSICIEESLFKLSAHRDRALNYKVEDVQITVVDELFVDQNSQGSVLKQTARVRLFFLAFMCGMPDVEVGVNDLVRQGKEVVGRHDIIPVVTEEWIRLEGVEFHNCVQQDEYERTRTIKFKPPDACYIELMRFRVRPPKNRELPLQLKTTMCITGNKVELKADVLVPGFTSRKLGQVPCEDVAIRFPIPECWIYLFRVEKHFRYGSVKSAHRRTGKVKGIERFLGTVDNLEPHLIEVTSGEAKYEHHHRSVVWRMHRLPKEGQGAYTTHNLVCRMTLTSYDQVPEQLDKYCYVEFTMPTTQVSHTTVRSVSIVNSEKDSPPEKYLRLMARHEYRVEIEHIHGEVEENPYLAATAMPKTPQPTIKEKSRVTNVSDSDSSS